MSKPTHLFYILKKEQIDFFGSGLGFMLMTSPDQNYFKMILNTNI